MKQKLLNLTGLRSLLLLACMTLGMSAWGDETGSATLTWSELNLSNSTSVNGVSYDLGSYFTVTCTKNNASTDPTYYTTGTAVRCYATKSTNDGNIITVARKSGVENVFITKVTYNGAHSKKGTTSFSYSGSPTETDDTSATYDERDEVTSASATLCEIGGSANGQFYFTDVKVDYVVVGSTIEVCATPSFSPAAGTYTSAQEVTISTETSGATIYYTTDGTDPTTDSDVYSSDIIVSETTTIKAFAVKTGCLNSSVASATYNIVQPLTTMDQIFEAATDAGSTAASVAVTFNNWVVTGVNGSQVFVTDGTKGFILYQSNHGFAVGDKLSGTAPCKVQLYKGAAEITDLTSTTTGLTITAGGSVSVADIPMADLKGVNTGALVSYKNLTCTVSTSGNKTNYVLSDGTTTIIAHTSLYNFTTNSELEDGKKYNVTGVFVQYDTTKEILPRDNNDIEEVVSTTPEISAENVTIEYDALSGEIAYAIANPVGGTSLNATTDADWITDITVYENENIIKFATTVNDGDADRTATITLSYEGAERKNVTVTQKHYVADYATLPFEFDGGKADIENTSGLTQEGLGGDYDSAPKLKFDGTGDYLILHFNERPGTLKFAIKGNSFSGGKFTVQTSEDGEAYTDLETYTELGTASNEEITNLGENVRYIKWIYTEKVNGNVALGNIALAEYSAIIVANPVFSVPSGTYTEAQDVEIKCATADATIYYTTDGSIPTAESTKYTTAITVSETTTIKAIAILDNVTSEVVTATYTINSGGDQPVIMEGDWVLTSFSELTTDDIFVIVSQDVTGSAYAMSNDNGTSKAPKAVSVTIADDKVSDVTSNIVWNLGGNATDGYIFYPNGDNEKWLYCINNNNGVRVGTNEGNTFTLDSESGYLKHSSTSRYLGVYNSQDWRCYLTYEGNIAGQTFSFYKKKVEVTPVLLGDVNGDEEVTIADVAVVISYILGQNPTDFNEAAANVDGQDGITISDVLAIINMIIDKE